MPGPKKTLTPITSGANTKFRYLNRGAVLPAQPSGQPGIHWSSCAIGDKKGMPGGGNKVQYAFGFTARGTELVNQSQETILSGVFSPPIGLILIAWGVIQNLYAHTEYVRFERPCSDTKPDKNAAKY